MLFGEKITTCSENHKETSTWGYSVWEKCTFIDV